MNRHSVYEGYMLEVPTLGVRGLALGIYHPV